MTAPMPVRPPEPPEKPLPATSGKAPVQARPSRLLAPLRETGKLFALAVAVARAIFRRPFQVR
ncbi:ABC transporter permease, partial [Streptomyces sp. SID7982]|nr:ABC transporter permease [Streptomyces sp. SID7982]